MKKKLGAVGMATAAALILVGCAGPAPADTGGTDITLWLMGGDTPDELRDFLKTEYADATGGTLTIEEQAWGDALAKLTTALPDSDNTPDVVEIGNTWSPTFTNVGAFSDISDLYEELGGDKLLPSFVEVGEVDGAQMALPYYFGSRYVFFRKDIWEAAGKDIPATLEEFNQTAAELQTDAQSGFYLGGQDWRNGVSWIFANDGELAVKDGGEWVSTLSGPNTIAGLEQLQALFQDASNAPVTEADSTPWVNINNNDATGAPEAATIIAPGWAHWSIGDLAPDPADDTKTIATWNDEVFGTDEQLGEIESALAAAVADDRLGAGRLAEAAARNHAFAVESAARRAEIPMTDAAAPAFDLARSRKAFDVKRGTVVAPHRLLVALETVANMAVGVAPWAAGAHRRLHQGEDLGLVTADQQLVLIGRDNHRHRWVREVIDSARERHPSVIVVDMGWPGGDRAYADVATFGASKHAGDALLGWLDENTGNMKKDSIMGADR